MKRQIKFDFFFVCLFVYLSRVSCLKEEDKKNLQRCGWKREAEMNVKSGLARTNGSRKSIELWSDN